MNNEQIATTIKDLCKENNIAILTMLEKCDINRNFIYDLEKRKSTPAVDAIARIADFFGVSIDYLVGETRQFICDVCGRAIDDPKKAFVVWKYDNNNQEGNFAYKIVHPKSQLDEHGEKYGCDYDKSYLESSSIADFLGERGLMRLLAMIDVGPIYRKEYKEQIKNMHDFLELFRRVQIPYYEEARFYFEKARLDGYFDGINALEVYSPSTLKGIIEKYKD